MSPIKVPGLSTYNGGKGGNGTWQTIINHIPPHDVFYSLFLGNCAVTRNIKPALYHFLNDIDHTIIEKWKKLDLDERDFCLNNQDALAILLYLTNSVIVKPGKSFIFLDPPYPMNTRTYKRKIWRFDDWETDEHDVFLDLITQKSMQQFDIMVCCYPNDLYDYALKGWETFDYQSMTRKGMRTERLYMNYKLTGELHDYRYTGNDYREREALNRQLRNFIRKFNNMPLALQELIKTELLKVKL